MRRISPEWERFFFPSRFYPGYCFYINGHGTDPGFISQIPCCHNTDGVLPAVHPSQVDSHLTRLTFDTGVVTVTGYLNGKGGKSETITDFPRTCFSNFVSKTGFDKDPIISPCLISQRMRPIPITGNAGKSWVAGEPLNNIQGNLCKMRENIQKYSFPGVSPEGIYCTGDGCNRCNFERCIYSDFIRHYWTHPRFD